MKLNFLNIKFQSKNEFLKSVDDLVKSKVKMRGLDAPTLKYDSEKTFYNIFTINKLQILRAISQFNPDSVYKLAQLLDREPHHVLVDCRRLESFHYIKLNEVNLNGRLALKPTLAFDYDVIKVHSKTFIQPFPISAKADKLIGGMAKIS